jgi:hypothetical protein
MACALCRAAHIPILKPVLSGAQPKSKRFQGGALLRRRSARLKEGHFTGCEEAPGEGPSNLDGNAQAASRAGGRYFAKGS